MKLDVNLDKLWINVKKMGADSVSCDLGTVWVDSEIEFDARLSTTGIEITIGDLDFDHGVPSIKGRQVLLYIPDHSFKFSDTVDNPSLGNKFHVAECTTLEKMRRNNRFARYQATQNTSGVFEIFGILPNGKNAEEKVRLQVCKNCLSKLNYKNAANINVSQRDGLAKSFNIEDFFTTYSSLFRVPPKQNIGQSFRGYTDDWPKVSSAIRSKYQYFCLSCKVNLIEHKRLLHVHHLNGEKSDNSSNNLIALCADCHRKEPYHERMYVKHSDTLLINNLRRKQQTFQNNNWSDLMKVADPAVFGLLNHCIKNGTTAPEVGHQVHQNGVTVAEFEIAWPNKRIGVTVGDPIQLTGWTIFGLDDAIEHFRKNRVI